MFHKGIVYRLCWSTPHLGGDLLLFLANGVTVDSGSFLSGMAHPFLKHVEWNTGGKGGNAVAVAESFGAFVRALMYRCCVHDLDYPPPGCGSGPGPQGLVEGRAVWALLSLPDAINHIQGVKDFRRNRNSSEYAFTAFFEGFKTDSAVCEIYEYNPTKVKNSP
jgi:hypothetical protein